MQASPTINSSGEDIVLSLEDVERVILKCLDEAPETPEVWQLIESVQRELRCSRPIVEKGLRHLIDLRVIEFGSHFELRSQHSSGNAA